MKNTMKEAQSLVDVLYSCGKFIEVGSPVEHEGETNTRKENEVIFCLREDPKYQISALAIWSENARGETVDPPHVYYRNILSGELCMDVWACRHGVVYDLWSEEKWDMLTVRIASLRPQDLQQIVCHEKKYAVYCI